MSDNKPLKRIFLLSHMRANTSLIGHILGSHPQVSGYYEMHLAYRSIRDLKIQEQVYTEKDTIKPEAVYLFDKLLHNKYPLLLENLSLNNAVVLLALRRAEPTLKSIINLFSKKAEPHHYAEPAHAVRYYRERLAHLMQFCRKHPSEFYYFDAELVRAKPESFLPRLQQWLSLDSPLSEHYQIFSKTGQAGAGDSSTNMQTGRIIKEQSAYQDISIPADLLEAAERDYRQCRKLLISHAIESAETD